MKVKWKNYAYSPFTLIWFLEKYLVKLKIIFYTKKFSLLLGFWTELWNILNENFIFQIFCQGFGSTKNNYSGFFFLS